MCPKRTEADPLSVKVGGELRPIGEARIMVFNGHEANLCYLEHSIGFGMYVTWV